MNRFEDLLSEVKGIIASDGKRDFVSHRVQFTPVATFTPQEIKQIRLNAHMTQSVFAQCIGVTQKSVEAWEGGRSHPDGAARRLLGLMKNNPDFARDAGILVFANK